MVHFLDTVVLNPVRRLSEVYMSIQIIRFYRFTRLSGCWIRFTITLFIDFFVLVKERIDEGLIECLVDILNFELLAGFGPNMATAFIGVRIAFLRWWWLLFFIFLLINDLDFVDYHSIWHIIKNAPLLKKECLDLLLLLESKLRVFYVLVC